MPGLLTEKLEKYDQNLNDDKTWDLLGHSKPEIDSVADLKELVAALDRLGTPGSTTS